MSLLNWYLSYPESSYFPDITEEELDAIIAILSSQWEALTIKERCKLVYDRWLFLSIILYLNAHSVEEGLDASLLVSHVKKDVVDSESREYFKPEKDPCKDCGDLPLGKIKGEIDSIEDICLTPSYGGSGSNFGCRKSSKGHCKTDEIKR